MNPKEIKKINQEIAGLYIMYNNSIQFRDWMSCDLISEQIVALENKLKDYNNEPKRH